MRILFITDYLPYPLVAGDRIRTFSLVSQVARTHEVTLVGFLQRPEDLEGISYLSKFCSEVYGIPLTRRHPIAHVPGLLRYGLAGIPLELKFLRSTEFLATVTGLLSRTNYDIVQIEHSRMAPYLEAVPLGSHVARVLDLHNVTSSQYERLARIELTAIRRIRSWLYSRMMRRWEPQYAERFDSCLAVSHQDREELLSANPRLHVEVIPNGVDTNRLKPLAPSQGKPALLFVGNMEYAPCADAAIWLCRQILPRIRRRLGEVEVWIVGSSPPPELSRLARDGVHVTGQVEDVVPFYQRSSLSIVPLRAGGGTRLKILESMALGRPVVSTTIGCEGLDVVDGEHLLVADEPEDLAESTISLLKDANLYQKMACQARQLVVSHYEWDSIAEQLLQVYVEVAYQNSRLPVSGESL